MKNIKSIIHKINEKILHRKYLTIYTYHFGFVLLFAFMFFFVLLVIFTIKSISINKEIIKQDEKFNIEFTEIQRASDVLNIIKQKTQLKPNNSATTTTQKNTEP